jgi:autophagy-related protein 5
LPKLHSFFREDLINEDALPQQGWFSYENVPLKWHFPIGLLFDIYSGHSDHLQDDSGHGPKKDSSPTDTNYGSSGFSRTWSITLHFDDWPSEVLAKVDDVFKSVRDAFTNSYKEASFIRFSSTKVVQRLSLEDALQYWDAVVKRQ